MQSNQVVIKSLSLYRQILKRANLIVYYNQYSDDRSHKVSELIRDEEMRDYIIEAANRHFRTTQRQYQSNKLTSEEMVKRLSDAKWIVHGLDCVMRDISSPTHKRKTIKQSPHLNLLNTAIQGYGNTQFHEELIDAFVIASKFDYENR